MSEEIQDHRRVPDGTDDPQRLEKSDDPSEIRSQYVALWHLELTIPFSGTVAAQLIHCVLLEAAASRRSSASLQPTTDEADTPQTLSLLRPPTLSRPHLRLASCRLRG